MIETPTPAIARDRRQSAPWLIVIVLLILYIFSFIDRVIINLMVQPIERDLGVSDFQMSFLLGPSFGLFYVISGLFMGWLVDRYRRRLIAGIGVVVWATATTFSGFAGNFVHLALGRMGVGVGESTLTPAAHAMIAENFPPVRLATAMSVFTVGAVIGAAIAHILGGNIVHQLADERHVELPLIGAVFGWQAVFIAVGLATLAISPLLLLIRETPSADRHARALADGTASQLSFGALIRRHWRLYILMPVAFGGTTILVAAYQSWFPTFMIRSYGWDAGQVGTWIGVQHLLAGVVGQIGGAALVDRLYRGGMTDAHARYHLIGLLASIPCMLLALYSGDPVLFLVLSSVFFCLTYPFVAYAAAALQLFTPAHLRGRVSAMFLAIVTILGTSIGPTATAWFTDHLFGDKARIGDSLALLTAIVAPVIFLLLIAVARAMRAMHAARDAGTL